jgi:chromosome partitioning protein
MNVITVVSCKAGTGKTTLTAGLAAYGCRGGRRCLVIDADPDRGFSRLNARRAAGAVPVACVRPVLEPQLEVAELLGYDWVLIDTASTFSPTVHEAVGAATILLIPARLGALDLVAVSRTTDLVHGAGKPYAVVLNAAPAPGDGGDLAIAEWRAWLERYAIPAWSGQISARANYLPAEGEVDGRALSAFEIAELWSMIDASVAAIGAMRAGVSAARHAA